MLKSLLMSLGTCASLCASLHQIDSIEEVRKYVPENGNTLCVFDVDYTLTMPSNPHAQLSNIIKYSYIYRDNYKGLTKDQGNQIRLDLMNDSDPILIEETSAKLIDDLRAKGVKVMACTASHRYYKGDGDWRARGLLKVGVDFSQQADVIAPSSDTFYKGILSCNFAKLKGPPLVSLLATSNYKPTTVVVVDDKDIHLESIETELSKMGIEVIGLHYQGAKNYPAEEVTEKSFIDYFTGLRSKVES